MTAPSYTPTAIDAVLEAVRSEPDAAAWLALVLCTAAARLGSSGALVAARPHSWEATAMLRLVRGTSGWEDEDLDSYTQ
jgi:hypothetical protein